MPSQLKGAAPHAKPLFTDEGPQLYGAAYAHNAPFAKPGPYQTKLSPQDEAAFRHWVVTRGVPTDPNAATSDYDMRGFWKANPLASILPTPLTNPALASAAWKPGQHFPDTFKTPYDTSFSGESRYAKAGTPFVWQGNNLVDTRTGQVIFGG